MKRKAISLLSIPILMLVGACGINTPGKVMNKVYVIVPSDKGSSFTRYLASVVKMYGMIPKLGHATDDKGYSIYVLDATSPSLRLRSQNVPLSGNEDPEQCGAYSEGHPDPGQYFITISQKMQTSNSQASHDLLIKIVETLKSDGYDVLQRPLTCSNLSKQMR